MKKYQGHLKQNCGIHGHQQEIYGILYQRSVTNISIKLFNKLPVQIKQLHNVFREK
jgi:hypothetical protein